jgi:hypothetical protein
MRNCNTTCLSGTGTHLSGKSCNHKTKTAYSTIPPQLLCMPIKLENMRKHIKIFHLCRPYLLLLICREPWIQPCIATCCSFARDKTLTSRSWDPLTADTRFFGSPQSQLNQRPYCTIVGNHMHIIINDSCTAPSWDQQRKHRETMVRRSMMEVTFFQVFCLYFI